MTPEAPRHPLPRFTRETAIEKVRLAEDGWNSRDAAKVALAYTLDTQWRNRATFIKSREEAQAFLTGKWIRELEYRLIKELWAFTDHRIAVRYAYEWHDTPNRRFPSILDFQELCQKRGIRIEQAIFIDSQTGKEVSDNPNLNADIAVMALSR